MCYLYFAWDLVKKKLTMHSHIHTVDNPYTCITCLKSIAQKGSLDVHICTHTNSVVCEYVLDKHVRTEKHQKIIYILYNE